MRKRAMDGGVSRAREQQIPRAEDALRNDHLFWEPESPSFKP